MIKSMVKVSKAQSSKVVTVSATLSRRWPEARPEGFCLLKIQLLYPNLCGLREVIRS